MKHFISKSRIRKINMKNNIDEIFFYVNSRQNGNNYRRVNWASLTLPLLIYVPFRSLESERSCICVSEDINFYSFNDCSIVFWKYSGSIVLFLNNNYYYILNVQYLSVPYDDAVLPIMFWRLVLYSHLHNHIISLTGEVWVNKTSLPATCHWSVCTKPCKWAVIYVFRVSILPLSTIFRFVFGTVLTMCYFWVFHFIFNFIKSIYFFFYLDLKSRRIN
jgi:hypothetical protein